MDEIKNTIIKRSVTLFYKKDQHNLIIFQTSKYPVVVDITKRVFGLTSPFALKYRISDNNFITIRDQDGLTEFIKRHFCAYCIYVMEDKPTETLALQLRNDVVSNYDFKEPKQTAETVSLAMTHKLQEVKRSSACSRWSQPDSTPQNDPQTHTTEYFTKVGPALSNGKFRARTEECKKLVNPQAGSKENCSFDPQPASSSSPALSNPTHDALVLAKQVQKVLTKYKAALEQCPSIFVTSQILVDQVLHGKPLDIDALQKTLKRRLLAEAVVCTPASQKPLLLEPAYTPPKLPSSPSLDRSGEYPRITSGSGVAVSPKAELDALSASVEMFGVAMDD